MMLNLGSGKIPRSGYVNVDIDPDLPGVDCLADLEKTWPWPDDSVDLAVLSHLLEHLPTPDHAMQELYRVLRPGARAVIRVPCGLYGLYDPRHIHAFKRSTFRLWCPPFEVDRCYHSSLEFPGYWHVRKYAPWLWARFRRVQPGPVYDHRVRFPPLFGGKELTIILSKPNGGRGSGWR